MGVSQLTLDQLASAAELAIENTAGYPEMLAAVAPYGYDAAELQRARTLLQDYRTVVRRYSDLRRQQVNATASLRVEWAAFKKGPHAKMVGLARIVLADDAATRRHLAIHGNQPQAFDGWAEAAGKFYQEILNRPDIFDRMARKGVTQAAVQAAYDALLALVRRAHARDALTGAVQQARVERDERMKALRAWLREYQDTARIALRGTPEWGERLGFFHRTTPRRRPSDATPPGEPPPSEPPPGEVPPADAGPDDAAPPPSA